MIVPRGPFWTTLRVHGGEKAGIEAAVTALRFADGAGIGSERGLLLLLLAAFGVLAFRGFGIGRGRGTGDVLAGVAGKHLGEYDVVDAER